MEGAMTKTTSFMKSGHLPTLIGSFLYFDISFMVWVLLGGLGNYIATDLGLSPTQKGLMTAIPLLSGAALRLVLGYMADEIGGRKTGLIGMALTLIPLMCGWLWMNSLSEVYLVGLLLGVAGASFAVALPLASRWYPPEHQGLAMGIAGAGNSGTVLAVLFAPRLAEAFGWHAVFGLAAIPILLVMVLFAIFAKDAPVSLQKKKWSEYASLLKEKDTYLFCLFYSITFGGFVGLASFLSILLKDQYGVSKVTAGDLTALCVFAGSLLRPLGGFVSDKFGGIRMLTLFYALVAVAAFSLSTLPGVAVGVALFFLMMGILGMGNGAVFQLVPQRFGNKVGIMTGIIGAAGGVGGFFLPTLLGWCKQATGSYGAGLAAFGLMAVGACVTLMLAQRDWVGVWIARGGRVQSSVPAELEEEAGAA
jgi:NNP family nitrate/nitrite transporter-like MFS transporter